VLVASGQVNGARLADHEFIGELALSGELRAIRGALASTLAARRSARSLVLPAPNAAEAQLVSDARVAAASHLLEVTAHLNGTRPLALLEARDPLAGESPVLDLADVKGQHQAKRALEIAATGGHHLLMLGPPGAGKTMLASRLGSILPPMSEEEALEAAAIHSLWNGFELRHWKQRPFRSPHHTASGVALVGGGTHPRPGEISLAHHGVLFLDELPEFDRAVLEVLREPLESGRVTIARAARSAEFPASFQLVAAMNP
jgi:magnesium chelatase family protein